MDLTFINVTHECEGTHREWEYHEQENHCH